MAETPKKKKSGWDMTNKDWANYAKKWVAEERRKAQLDIKKKKQPKPKRSTPNPGATTRRSAFTYIPKK